MSLQYVHAASNVIIVVMGQIGMIHMRLNSIVTTPLLHENVMCVCV